MTTRSSVFRELVAWNMDLEIWGKHHNSMITCNSLEPNICEKKFLKKDMQIQSMRTEKPRIDQLCTILFSRYYSSHYWANIKFPLPINKINNTVIPSTRLQL